tara:strand:- start:1960 stop:2904 length:945 start_codon:yes stop_codon:yes gene_type:complete
MSLNHIRADILNIVDIRPSWLERLSYNPIENIIKTGKTHHILHLLEEVFGFMRNNPILGEVRFFHYKNASVDNVLKDLRKTSPLISKIEPDDIESLLDLLTLLSKIHYFKVYNKKDMDFLSREIIKSELIDKTSNLKFRAMFLFYMERLGYSNIFSDKCLSSLKECQNDDGGWSVDISSAENKSDVFTTLLVFRSFVINNLWSNKKFLDKTESYLCQNHLSANQSSEELDKWNRLYSGCKRANLFEGGSVLLLESLLLSKKKNSSKIKSITNWLKELQFKDGYFPYHAKLKTEKNIPTTIKVLSLIKKESLMSK